MKIHEYQAKEILRGYGVAVPRGKLVQSAEEAVAAARELMAGGKGVAVVKAQIHAGGRGKGGGVKLARSPGVGSNGVSYGTACSRSSVRNTSRPV